MGDGRRAEGRSKGETGCTHERGAVRRSFFWGSCHGSAIGRARCVERLRPEVERRESIVTVGIGLE